MNDRFRIAAEKVRRRLVFERWSILLKRSAPWLFGIVLAAAMVYRLVGYHLPDLRFAVAVLGAWLVATAAWAWLGRPGRVAALAEWDERAERPETFVSAYAFALEPEPRIGELLHIERAEKSLDEAISDLPRLVRPRIAPRTWAPPLISLCVLASSLGLAAPDAADIPLDADALARVAEISQTIEEQADRFRTDAFEEKDRDKANELKEKLADAAARLKEPTAHTPRSVLEELESIAREAEKLARSMGAGEESVLSSGLIEELERHAETADLGAALRSDDTGEIADESDQLADKLDREDRTIEQTERIERALSQAMKAADDRDRKTLAGRQLGEAEEQLKADDPEKAAEAIRDLAREMDRRLAREKAGERLERLAADLRANSQRMLGRSNEGQLRQLAAGNAPGGLRPVDGRQLAMAGAPGQQPQGDPQFAPAGHGDPNAAQPPQAPGNGAPQPGPVPGQQPGGGAGPPPGQQPPVPGQGRGQNPGAGMAGGNPPVPGQGLGAGAGQGQTPGGAGLAPIPGGGAGSAGVSAVAPGAGAGVGGLDAGNGSAALTPHLTNPHAGTHTDTVAAAPVNAGASLFRTVEGAPHREATQREARALAIQQIRAQEEALDAEPLPLARREQVLRYYRLLRSHLEPESEPSRDE